MAVVYIGIGSNIGNRQRNFNKAISILDNDIDIDILSTSSFYETKPVGGPPQKNYLNGVIKLKTELRPKEFLNKLKRIEYQLGRRKSVKNGPRIIDLDILMFDDMVLDTHELIIPHPRMHERAFVLKGFSEIAPDLMHPLENKSIKELFESTV